MLGLGQAAHIFIDSGKSPQAAGTPTQEPALWACLVLFTAVGHFCHRCCMQEGLKSEHATLSSLPSTLSLDKGQGRSSRQTASAKTICTTGFRGLFGALHRERYDCLQSLSDLCVHHMCPFSIHQASRLGCASTSGRAHCYSHGRALFHFVL